MNINKKIKTKTSTAPEVMTVPLGTVTVTPRTHKYISQILATGRFSYGPFSEKFESEFARLHNRKFAMFMNSGTSALQVALHTLKELHQWKDGDEVLVPAITFVATSNIVIQNNLTPIFVDVDPLTYNIDPSKIEEKITKKTRAIIPVHLFGLSAQMDTIMTIARQHNLKVLEDSCETMLVNYKNKPVGSRGDIACFSTYVAHILVTGVGGLALTDNTDYAISIKSLMNHGRDSIYLHIDDDRNTSNDKKLFNIVNKRFRFVSIGYSYRATEFEAALGLAALEKKDVMIRKRQKNAAFLLKHLQQFSGHLQLPSWPPYAQHAFMYFPIVIKHPRIKRDKLITLLETFGVETRYMLPLINQPVYKKLFGNLESKFPVARWINNNGFYVACHQDLSQAQLRHIVDVFTYALKKLTS